MARQRLVVVPSGYTILVIDDQDSVLISMRLLLEHEGHTVRTAQSGPAGLTSFRAQAVRP
jgi:CheY-like chemotaxis protein